MDYDIIIVGGGPAGLSFARAMAGTGLSIAIVEQQELEALADPPYDGREIALTHRSIRWLTELGAWDRIDSAEISPLKEARVLNGNSPFALTFDTGRHAEGSLGVLISNHDIRKALYDCVSGHENVTLLCGMKVVAAHATSLGVNATLSDGQEITGRLLVVADSRFSSVRPKLGIRAEMNQLGKAMLVCRVSHEGDHGQIATEWFGRGHTIAMLPLNGRISSAVLTLPLGEAERIAGLPDEALANTIARRFDYRLGSMSIASSRHVYPLTTSFADRFAVPGAALIGDTAVGMHPVTAHGFNLGLASAMTLAQEIKAAMRLGLDWAGESVLTRYEHAHRRASRPIFRATAMIVGLYNDERLPARLARRAAIRLGRRLPFVRTTVSAALMRG